jgi:hypothetical protein
MIEPQASHELSWDQDGRLVFTQMQSETHLGMGEFGLYSVRVSIDIENMDFAKGLTLEFDKHEQALRPIMGVPVFVAGCQDGRHCMGPLHG